jgi:hypothetical protein
VATTWWLAVLVALFMMLIVVEQNRNEVVSVLDGSQPNRLTFDRDFLSRVGLHGLLPIVALGAAHSAAVSQFVASWIQPLSRFFGKLAGLGGGPTVSTWGDAVNAGVALGASHAG